jgi:phage terminase large subunit-like protein
VGTLARKLGKLRAEENPHLLDGLDPDGYGALVLELFDWEGTWARPDQCEPKGSWRKWFIKGGRGSGKTRTGAELVRKKVETSQALRVALVGRTSADVRDTMIEGESGLLAVASPGNQPHYNPSLRRVEWKGTMAVAGRYYQGRSYERGPMAVAFSSAEPDLLRGPQHDFAWADEIAAWSYATETWDNLMLGLRIGQNPQVVVTSTPRPIKIVRDLVADPQTIVTNPSTFANMENLAPAFAAEILLKYQGTEKGRQELYGELLEEAEGALWRRAWLERDRVGITEVPTLAELVVAIDPAVSAGDESNETGIVAVGGAYVADATSQGRPAIHVYTLRDVSGRYSPDGWARRAVELYDELKADAIVAERNQGGDMVEHTIRTVPHPGRPVPVYLVSASRGKRTRAEPVAALSEQGRYHHVRTRWADEYDEDGALLYDAPGVPRRREVPNPMPELEDQLCNWEPGLAESPDRMDATVWGATKVAERGTREEFRLARPLGESDRASNWRTR